MTEDDLRGHAFTLSPEEFRKLGYAAVDLAANYLKDLPTRPVFQPVPDEERVALMGQSLSEDGIPPDHLLRFVEEHILPWPMGNGNPRFFAWVNSPPAMLAAIMDLLASTMNPSCAGGDHAAVYLERCAVRWLMELIQYPVEGSMGLLVSGGSAASLTCLTVARHWAAKQMGWNVRTHGLQAGHPDLVLYLSEEGHSCMRKAAELLGLGGRSVRLIPVDDHFRMDRHALRDAIQHDRSLGSMPFCVGASAGTVNTGAIDPLDDLAELCAEENLWLHVDGAYAGFGILDPARSQHYHGMERAQSVAIDPHKWLSVPLECGCAIVRDGSLMRDAFSLMPEYLRQTGSSAGLPWYSEYGFQQSRGFRALKLWAVLAGEGRRGLSRNISQHNLLAQALSRLVDHEASLERLAPVTLSIVCFRYRPDNLPQDTKSSEQELNRLNQVLLETLQSEGRVFLSGTTLRGRFALRACILNYATTYDDIEFLVKTVVETGKRVSHGT